MSRIITLAILLLLVLEVHSQEGMSFRQADSITYSLFLQENWKALSHTGSDALKEGHDYFYMRLRLGIAYFKRSNYGLAELHLKKALEFNSFDKLAAEYLFYCYYFSARNDQAMAMLKQFTGDTLKRIMKESGFKKNNLTVETFNSNAATGKIMGDAGTFFINPEPGSQIVTRNFLNNQIYLSHYTGFNTRYFHSLTGLIKDNYLHYYDGVSSYDLPIQRIFQYQYYGRLVFFTGSGWSFSPALHLLTSRYPYISISYYQGMTAKASTYTIRDNGMAGAVEIKKRGKFLTVSGEVVYSYLSRERNFQGSLDLEIYPAGNRNFYLGASIAGLFETGNSPSSASYVKGLTAGLGFFNRIWLEFSGSLGNMKNYSEDCGLFLFNSEDYLTGKYLIRILVPFYKPGLTLYAGAGQAEYRSEFYPFDGSGVSNNITYSNFNLTGGISWNF